MKVPLLFTILAVALVASGPRCTAQFAPTDSPNRPKPAPGATPPRPRNSDSAPIDPNKTPTSLVWNAMYYDTQAPDYGGDSRLNTPVHVEMIQATIQQAVQSLTSSSGVSINLDKDVAFTGRLSVEARSVPLRTVMEGIAQQTHLMIQRNGNGYVYTSWPSLTINGQKRSIDWPGSPWAGNPALQRSQSGAWTSRPYKTITTGPGANTLIIGGPSAEAAGQAFVGQDPYVLQLQSGQTPVGDIGAALSPEQVQHTAPVPLLGSLSGQNPAVRHNSRGGVFDPERGALANQYGLTGPSSDMNGGGLTVTSLGERMFVVSEPERGTNGTPGYRLTVYRLDSGDKLRKVSSIFHPSSAAATTALQYVPLYWNYWSDSPNQPPKLELRLTQPINGANTFFNRNNNIYQYVSPNIIPAPSPEPFEQSDVHSSGGNKKDNNSVAQPPKVSVGAPNEQEQPVAPPVRSQPPASP